MIGNNFLDIMIIKDLQGTKVMYFYVHKLLFVTPQSYFPNQAVTSEKNQKKVDA